MSVAGLVISFSYSQIATATTGEFFSVSRSGAALNITAVDNPNHPNKVYWTAGIKMITPGFSLSDCTPDKKNGFCLFPVSHKNSATLTISGPSGVAFVVVCMNGTGSTANCEKHQIDVPHIVFITEPRYNGNLGGVSGADSICQSDAYVAGSHIPPGHTFKALLVSSARYPCSSKNGGVSGQCGGEFANDWPLKPGTPYYYPDGQYLFNTVNENGVFDGSVRSLRDVNGRPSEARFASGVNSVFTNADASDLAGWAYDDMNSALDAENYKRYNHNCSQWTDSSHRSDNRGSYGVSGYSISIHSTTPPPSTWGNYYDFADTAPYDKSYYINLWIYSDYDYCDTSVALVCVG